MDDERRAVLRPVALQETMLLDASLWHTIVQDDFVGNIGQLYTPNKTARRSEPFVSISSCPIRAPAANPL